MAQSDETGTDVRGVNTGSERKRFIPSDYYSGWQSLPTSQLVKPVCFLTVMICMLPDNNYRIVNPAVIEEPSPLHTNTVQVRMSRD